MSFTYEIDDFYIYTGFLASVSNATAPTENFDPQESLLLIPGASLLKSNIEAAFPLYTLTGLANFNYEVRTKIQTRSNGYTRLRQIGLLRDLPPVDTYGFLDVSKHFAQTVQRTAYNYNKSGDFLNLISSNIVNDFIGFDENLESFYDNYKNLNFTTIKHNVETYSFLEPTSGFDTLLDNNIFEVLSRSSLNNLQTDSTILDSNFNVIDPPSVTDIQRKSKNLPFATPHSIDDIDDDSSVVQSVDITSFNYYYAVYTEQYKNVLRRFKDKNTNLPAFMDVLSSKNDEFSNFLESFNNVEKGYRVRIQQTPKFKMNKLSLYGTMEESSLSTEATSGMAGTAGMSSGTSGGGTSGVSY